MKITQHFSSELKDRNNNTVVRIEFFPVNSKNDLFVVRVTNYIYSNSCVKKFDNFQTAYLAFNENVKKYCEFLANTQSRELTFKNRFMSPYNKDKSEGPTFIEEH